MLQLTVNGASQSLDQACSLPEALDRLGFGGRFFAVAINGDFVPRSRYASISLNGGERIEILAPMQGG